MISEKRSLVYSLLATIGVIVVVLLLLIAFPSIKTAWNNYQYSLSKIDEKTDYKTLKKVEDTCRAYIASYEADKVTYETLRDATDEVSIETARSAKIRANRTAAVYNNYYLENSYVWKDNIPSDIYTRLEILE